MKPAWIDAAAKECADKVLVGEGQRAFAEIIGRHASDQRECNVLPPGWRCTRGDGHDGPCAAVPDSKCGEVLVFEGGSLTINLSGYGNGNGKAELVIDEDDLVDGDENESGTVGKKMVIDASEILEIQKFLSRVLAR